MPWPGAGPRAGLRMREQLAGRRVERVDDQLIDAQIGNDHKAIVGRGCSRVRVRPLLALWVGAAALMLNEVGRRAKRAIGRDAVDADAARAVIRRQQPSAGRVERQMAGRVAATELMIDWLDRPRISVEAKRVNTRLSRGGVAADEQQLLR